MPAKGFQSIGIMPDVKSELESFRGEIIAQAGKYVSLSEVIRIAVRASRGKISELIDESTHES